MSRNILGTLGARRNIRIMPKRGCGKRTSLPRDVRAARDSKDWDLWENKDGEKFLVTGAKVTGFGDAGVEFIEKIPVSLEQDSHKKPVPRAYDPPVMPRLCDMTDEERGKGEKTRRSKAQSKVMERASMLGLHYSEVGSEKEFLQEKWDSDESVTRKEIRLLGLYLSEMTGVGPYAPEFKSMKTRWGSARYKTEMISFYEELRDHSRIWAYHVLIHEYTHVLDHHNGRKGGTPHDKEFKKLERKLHRRFNLDVEYYDGGVYAILDAETKERLVMHDDGEPDEVMISGF